MVGGTRRSSTATTTRRSETFAVLTAAGGAIPLVSRDKGLSHRGPGLWGTNQASEAEEPVGSLCTGVPSLV